MLTLSTSSDGCSMGSDLHEPSSGVDTAQGVAPAQGNLMHRFLSHDEVGRRHEGFGQHAMSSPTVHYSSNSITFPAVHEFQSLYTQQGSVDSLERGGVWILMTTTPTRTSPFLPCPAVPTARQTPNSVETGHRIRNFLVGNSLLRPDLSVARKAFEVQTEALPAKADWHAEAVHQFEKSYEEIEHVLAPSTARKHESGRVSVFVMLPLDGIAHNNTVNRRKAMNFSLQALKNTGVEGIVMDVWWGLVEREAPGQYNWSGYRELLEMAKKHGLKVQAAMSFHQCGGNVGDSVTIPLPRWAVEEIDHDNDLAYTDHEGRRNYEYISLGCDELPVLKGRTPDQCYFAVFNSDLTS
ncbi:hypothetical protein SUGI_0281460 [Cryptomeria japonica]|nr:hypothetical protein SUGI_0281460 [Cryptomeria japonica]